MSLGVCRLSKYKNVTWILSWRVFYEAFFFTSRIESIIGFKVHNHTCLLAFSLVEGGMNQEFGDTQFFLADFESLRGPD